ncbi:MAG TPA: OB-fold domain-containing protein [Candidatus Woesebacteria bacterium]|nr:OB-fold domain-containing protein [Candidatus Woesebacteria bacterium]
MKSAVTIWRKQKKDKLVLGKKGRVLTWTTINVAPPKFSSFTPYSVVLVELEDKEKVYGQLVDFEEKDLQIGTEVVSVLRRSGHVDKEDIIEYSVKFKPIG